MAASIFIYNLLPDTQKIASDIYTTINTIPDDSTNYFNLELLGENELSGEYFIVQTVSETFYNAEQRTFEVRQVQKASVVYFYIINNTFEIWGNRTNANRLIFALSKVLKNNVSINAVELSIENIINKLKDLRVKVSKVCFEDFLFTEDIVGNFTVDLSTYSDALSVLNKYRTKISRMTLILFSDGTALKASISSKGTITVYKTRDSISEDVLAMLHSILLK